MAANTAFPPVRACLFDMDGLLIDSEDLYTLCTNEVLHKYGKPDLPWRIKAQLQGRPMKEANKVFQEWAQLPVSLEVFHQELSVIQKKHFSRSQPLPGVPKLLSDLSNTFAPKVHIALATSSHKDNYDIKISRLQNLFSVFLAERIVLGDDPRIPQGKGKPAPDIYLLALKTINDGLQKVGEETPIKPEECLVFEDSVLGIEAGRRAGMRVVWVPHPGLLKECSGREKEVLAGLTGEQKSGEIKDSKAVEKSKNDVGRKEEKLGQRVIGSLGSIDDGWGELLPNLEDFPYSHYGINIGADRSLSSRETQLMN